jgi:hydrogenase maturation protease
MTPYVTQNVQTCLAAISLMINLSSTFLVLGVGNTLCADDGAGVHVVEMLSRDESLEGRGIVFLDGGTIALSLLPEIQNASAVIVVDAAEIGAEPGAVRSFEGADMDAQLRGKKRTAHEVAVGDLFAAAEFSGSLPPRRALIAIQPASTSLGLDPTAPVRAAIPQACAEARRLIETWSDAPQIRGDQNAQ